MRGALSSETLEGMSSLIDGTRSRPTSSRPGRGRTGSGRVGGGRPGPNPDLARKLLTVAFRPSGLTMLLIAAVVVVTLVSASSDLTGTFGAIATTWLVIHQVPATISGVQLGVLPLLPTAVMMWVVARRCASTAVHTDSRDDTLRLVGAAVAGPLTITAIALAVVADASAAIPLSSPNTLAAFGWVAGIHLIAASVGVAAAHWDRVVAEIPPWTSAAVRPAAAASAALLAAGAVAVVVSLLVSWSTVGDLLARGNGFVGVLGLTVLSLLYLPNLVVGAAAVMTGSTADFGNVSISVFGNIGGDLPPLPLLGAVPEGVAGGIWPVLLVVPAAVGVMLGRDCARRIAGQDSVLAVLTAAAGAGVVMALLALAAGGDLGQFGTVEVLWWGFGLLTFAWLGLFGTVSALFAMWFSHRGHMKDEVAPPTAEPARASEPELAITAAATTDGEDDENADEVLAQESAVVVTKVVEAEIVEESGEPVQVVTEETVEIEVVDAEVVAAPEADPTAGAEPETDLPSKPQESSD